MMNSSLLALQNLPLSKIKAMLENLINLVKEHAGDAIINNPAVPNENNEAVINTAATGIFESLKGGNLEEICQLFRNGNVSSNPIVGQISQTVSAKLAEKFGMDAASANNIAAGLIPKVMSSFVNKTNDSNDNSFTIDGIMQSIGGSGGMGSLMDKAKGLFGN